MSSTDFEDTGTPVDQDVTESAATSSSAEPAGEKTTLDLVQEALGGKEASPASETGEDQPEAKAQEGGADPKEGESEDTLTEEEKRTLSQRSRNRFHRLVETKKALEGQLSEVKPKAENFDRFVNYLQSNDLSAEDVENTLGIAAMIKKGDAAGAYQKVLPIFQKLAQAVGAVLPPQYQERVRLGHLSEQDARQLVQTEATARLSQYQLQRHQQMAQAQAERQQLERLTAEVVSAGDSWAQTKAQSDPDWSLRKDLVVELIGAELRQRGVPPTAQDVYALCEEVDKRVRERLKPFAAPKREMRPVTGVGSSPRSTPEPKNTLDVLNNTLAGIR
ncbi:hypothetical protein [Rhodoligotrophos defluvii]|uniref:hypothetical protein n=1 Tax=Rhodoligotrophos defluvii TaxID=2561934 RepID=UPI0010C9898E|nr:hypothetical protein [Rhodoligotrophos defluvii]